MNKYFESPTGRPPKRCPIVAATLDQWDKIRQIRLITVMVSVRHRLDKNPTLQTLNQNKIVVSRTEAIARRL